MTKAMKPLINDQEALRRDEEKKQKLSPLQQIMQNAPGLETSDPSAKIPGSITPVGPAAQPAISQEDNLSMLDSIISRPPTAQDVERRKRAATSVAAVGQLGNLISAFSNLAGTTGGAAPQTIPGYQGPDIDSWQDRAYQKQLQYANMMNAIGAQEWEQAYKDRQLAMQDDLNRQAQANKDREFAEQQRQFDATLAQREKQAKAELESLDAYRRGQVNANQTRADKYQGGGTGRSGSGTPNNDTIAAGDFEYTFNRREGNSATWRGMYQAIPKEWLSQLPNSEQVHYYDSNTDMTRKQQELIIRYAAEHPEYMEEMMNRYPSVLTRKKVQANNDTFNLNSEDTFDLNN